MPTFYEFFAGGGMARAGLGCEWHCLLANDFDRKKGQTYADNWGETGLVVDDIRNIGPEDMVGKPDLVWGSFPCQDLSLAGGGAGLRGDRSGTFWPFIEVLRTLRAENRSPPVVAVENVLGTLTSHAGKDFQAIIGALADLGYRPGAFVADAALFVPQSRPRLFVVAVRDDLEPIGAGEGPHLPWHTPALRRAFCGLPDSLADRWIWWDMPVPSRREMRFADIIEDKPTSVKWHTSTETRTLLSMMSEVNLAKVKTAQASGVRMVGGVYKRTRWAQGVKVQRAEVRFDDVAGCLRTPAGGSSRQLILVVEGEKIRSRLISSRETARLMGLPNSYRLPAGYNEAYHLTGDGVAVPVVRHIAKYIIEPIVSGQHTLRAIPSYANHPLREE
ncbi:DNA cytosine methyltransferase [Castellaniella sp.]|uniref:DNA cytosine methyltransferase n=1 Tax=Castellaniella sp. TaxID=1955812 RepID=UPI002AFDE02B|nr:DNA cytosine methyltransferase [Castellaniella sp.]